ncbi:hypothetical protein [Pontibacter harenae]|uniref:hypothetical protein n=1 Tax=Pontibacter harenae TaxID=2894083 RepID=UPI001E5EBCCD|nr:hypothetical protein [Pontibacter harenae]MCC9167750.1 hypothetical protein [Pontibacter harenae]
MRFLAHVARPSSFGEAAGEAMLIGNIGKAIEVCLFYNRDEAIDWLKSKQSHTQAQLS